MNRAAATLAAALHAALIASAVTTCSALKPPPQPRGDDQAGPEPVGVFIAPGQGDGPPCDGYEGIGLMHTPDGRVTDVAPRSPAERAGIRLGDVLVDPFNIDARRPTGTLVRLAVTRDGRTHHYALRTERICIEGE